MRTLQTFSNSNWKERIVNYPALLLLLSLLVSMGIFAGQGAADEGKKSSQTFDLIISAIFFNNRFSS